MIFKFEKIEIWRTFLVGVPIHPAVPIHHDLRYLKISRAVATSNHMMEQQVSLLEVGRIASN